MTRIMTRNLIVAFFGLAFATTNATAGSSSTKHGVRVHKLNTTQAASEPANTLSRRLVTPHRHKIVLHKGQRVIVHFGDGIGRSRYRKRYPGVQRPWQDRRFGRKHRRYLNPKGLYTSKIYRRGYD